MNSLVKNIVTVKRVKGTNISYLTMTYNQFCTGLKTEL